MKEIHMEDIRDINLEAFKLIESRLKEFDINLTPEQEDEIYLPLTSALEKITKYPDYRSYN